MLTVLALLHVVAARDDTVFSAAPPNWDLPPPAYETLGHLSHNPSAHEALSQNPSAHEALGHNPSAHEALSHNPSAHEALSHNPSAHEALGHLTHRPSASETPSPPAYETPSPDTPQPISTTHWHEPTPHELNHHHNSKPYARVSVNSTHLPANFTHIEELIAQAARAVAGAAAANAIADLLVHSAEDAFTSVQALIDAPQSTDPPH